ncbi:type II secretion system protein GspG [bacterium]|nr:type II secretion system protein GspG [bacterium]
MLCPKCGKEIEEESRFCKYCGEKLAGEAVKEEITKQPKTSRLAIASPILGILFFVPFAPLLAIIFGITALIKISKSKGEIKGEGLAIAGVVLGGLMIIFNILVLAIVLPRFMVCQRKADGAGAWADMDAMTTAMEMYYLDCDYYPSGKGKRATVGFDALVKNVENNDGWSGPYMKFRKDVDGNNIPEDPWGNEYEYEAVTSNTKEYTIWCKGKEGDYKAYYINAGDFKAP